MEKPLSVYPRELFDSFGLAHGTQQEIGCGVEQVVQNDPYFDQLRREGVPGPSAVWKLNIRSLRTCNTKTPEKNEAAIRTLAVQHHAQYRWLVEEFGADFVPSEQSQPRLIYLSEADKLRVWPDGDAPELTGPFCILVTLQDRAHELEDSDSILQLGLPYAELQGPVDETTYAVVNDRWFIQAAMTEKPTFAEIEQFLTVQQGSQLEALLNAANKREAVRGALIRIVRGAMQYGYKHGQTLDFMGEYNVILTTQGTAKLIDPLVTPESLALQDMSQAMYRAHTDENPIRHTWATLLNGLWFVRSLNFLAAYLELPDRIYVSGGVKNVDWQRVQSILTSPPPPRTPVHS